MRIRKTGENRFSVFDEKNKCLGRAVIERTVMERIFPDRPVQYKIRVSASETAKHLLYGAAITRAKVLAAKEPQACRVYADVDADDATALEVLKALGFKNYDGVVRMVKPVTDERVLATLPEGCTVVRDYLARETEFEKCLRRYNECFAEENDAAWLEELTEKPDFARLMLVSEEGICGEALVWSDGMTGVVGVLQTARAWRRKGVASYLLEDARKYFASLGLTRMSFDMWRASPGCPELAISAGFTEKQILKVYPEMV